MWVITMRKKNKQKFSSIIKNNLFMLKKVIKYAPDYFVLKLIHGFLCGISDFISTYLTLKLLDEVSSNGSFVKAANLIGLMALLKLFFIGYDKN
jgi:hypothetical protein